MILARIVCLLPGLMLLPSGIGWLLNPAETKDGFYAETGWTSINNKILVPTKETMWSVVGNNVLSENKPITLEWNNGEGIIFKKIIELDDKFLFKIKQQVQNNTNKPINLYPYNGLVSPNSSRIDIKPGISASANVISFLPHSAKEISFTL